VVRYLSRTYNIPPEEIATIEDEGFANAVDRFVLP
jgi:hypothetical protein